MTSKDTSVADATKKKTEAAAELTAALAALATEKSPQAFRRVSRAQEAKLQADRRAAQLGG